MLPVALLAVTIAQNAQVQPVDAIAVQPESIRSSSAQPVLSNGAQPDVLLAQSITPADGSTIVTSTGSQIDVTGGQFSEDGTNLFHSFQQFGLGDQQTANFVANPQVQNVLGRVLGGDASYIDGVLQVSNSNANLYLINPAGILFGQNAQLNLTGSFTAATADRVGFEDGWLDIFNANDYSQLVGDPTQFSFSAPQPGSVVNLGNLAVDEHQNLTLLGGNVVYGGSASAPGGRVTLGAVKGQQIVTLGSANGLLTMELALLPTDRELSIASLPELLTGGDSLSQGSQLVVAPDGTVSLQGVTIPDHTGTTAVAGNLSVTGQVGGELNLLGDRVALLGADLAASGTTGGGTVRIGGGYQGNDNILNADLTYISPDSTIDVSGGDTGDGGLAIAWADGLTQFYGSIDASGGSQSGQGGFVEISGKNQLVFRGHVDTNAVAGQMGTLLLDPINIVIAAGTGDGDGDSSNTTFQGDVNGVLGQILESDFPGGTVTLFESELEGLSGDTNIILQATNNITLNNLSDNELTFLPGSSTIEFDAGNNFIMDGSDAIATNGRGLIISGNTLTLGSLLTEGGDIDLTGNILLPANATFSTGAGQPGDISIGGSSSNIDRAAGLASLELISGDGNIDLNSMVGQTAALSTFTIQGATVDFFQAISTTNGITITAQDLPSFGNLFGSLDSGGTISISSQGDISSRQDNITAGGNISITTPGDLTIESGNLSATGDISLISGSTAFVSDLPDRALTINAGNQLTLQGTDRLRVQASNNPVSELWTTTGDLILSSNGAIAADASFNAGNNFLTLDLAGNPGDISGTSTDTLISSAGNVSFGDYTGLALKVEAQGSISGGDITIIGPNPALAGGDSDITILNSSPALILRAGGVLQNAPNLPANTVGGTVGGTEFSSTTATTPGNIDVGDIDTTVTFGDGGPVILSATGSVTAGNIDTSTTVFGDPLFPPYFRGGSLDINAGEEVTTQAVTTDGGEITISGTQIKTGSLTAFNEDTNLSNIDPEGRISLTATAGDIEVDNISAGAGGLTIDATERFRAVGETIDFNTGIVSGAEGVVETVVTIKDSPEIIDYLVSEGFDRGDLEGSEATVSIFNNLTVPASVIAYSSNSTTSNISIIHGGVDLPDSATVQIDGGSETYEFAIGPNAGPGLSGDLTGFNPLDPSATVTLFRTGDYTVYDAIPETISGTVGAIIVGNDQNNGQVYSAFLNRPLPPEIDPPTVASSTVVVDPEVDNPVTEDPTSGEETLVAADDPDIENDGNDSLCQPDEVASDLIASRSGEERSGDDFSESCGVPAADTILQIEEDINVAPEAP
ncbi:two-partner secretion domain-containing protein [Leptothoe spongobia]|uniref:Filamentous hemagglutinin N-terminal domain-containing protein n=1 Tax=Leptothoe spongobia TAU-MAC 1115 TaxID=1967444 RepID=A0A947DGT4_9CYAN|nr:filamentous hemagglutinin N-terminal domain-containing protein [Leptothoe spongobia]MBT9316591.1 filamentous hemagglutinin N-terminal domain-containing protein [Leptothoe spongobia TAU-MAC 1115]